MASTLMASSRLLILACMLTSVTAFNVPMSHPPVRYAARSRPVFSLFESLGSRFGRDGETDNDVATSPIPTAEPIIVNAAVDHEAPPPPRPAAVDDRREPPPRPPPRRPPAPAGDREWRAAQRREWADPYAERHPAASDWMRRDAAESMWRSRQRQWEDAETQVPEPATPEADDDWRMGEFAEMLQRENGLRRKVWRWWLGVWDQMGDDYLFDEDEDIHDFEFGALDRLWDARGPPSQMGRQGRGPPPEYGRRSRRAAPGMYDDEEEWGSPPPRQWEAAAERRPRARRDAWEEEDDDDEPASFVAEKPAAAAAERGEANATAAAAERYGGGYDDEDDYGAILDGIGGAEEEAEEEVAPAGGRYRERRAGYGGGYADPLSRGDVGREMAGYGRGAYAYEDRGGYGGGGAAAARRAARERRREQLGASREEYVFTRLRRLRDSVAARLEQLEEKDEDLAARRALARRQLRELERGEGPHAAAADAAAHGGGGGGGASAAEVIEGQRVAVAEETERRMASLADTSLRLRQQRRQLSGALETAADRLDEIDLALRALRGGGLRGLDELLGQRGRLSRSLRVFVEKLML